MRFVAPATPPFSCGFFCFVLFCVFLAGGSGWRLCAAVVELDIITVQTLAAKMKVYLALSLLFLSISGLSARAVTVEKGGNVGDIWKNCGEFEHQLHRFCLFIVVL